jgi:hypothetical protein
MSRRSAPSSSSKDTTPRKGRKTSGSRSLTAIVGGMLLAAAVLWFGWLLFHPQERLDLSTLPIPGIAPSRSPAVQMPPLVAAGITLRSPTQPAALNQQQALLIARQLEPDAATKAKSTSAQYVLLSYPSTSTPATHPDFNNVPAWMIVYQKIPLEPADASVDPTPFPHSYHDLYVFLDANNGKELLVISV